MDEAAGDGEGPAQAIAWGCGENSLWIYTPRDVLEKWTSTGYADLYFEFVHFDSESGLIKLGWAEFQIVRSLQATDRRGH